MVKRCIFECSVMRDQNSILLRRGGHMACVVALLHDASGRQASCDAGAFDSNGATLKWKDSETTQETESTAKQ